MVKLGFIVLSPPIYATGRWRTTEPGFFRRLSRMMRIFSGLFIDV